MTLSLLATPLIFALALFLPAGTWAWWDGWVFILVLLSAGTTAGLYVVRANPEIMTARSRVHEGTKGWDRILLGFLIPTMLSIFPVAALDAGRFHWSPEPRWTCLLGYALLLAGIGLTAWAQAVNRFFEPGVRIQTDRGQKVIDSGPYAVVRHPGYVAACLLFVGIALSLGSLWALPRRPGLLVAGRKDPLGGPDVAGRVGGVRGLHAEGPLQVDSGGLVGPSPEDRPHSE